MSRLGRLLTSLSLLALPLPAAAVGVSPAVGDFFVLGASPTGTQLVHISRATAAHTFVAALPTAVTIAVAPDNALVYVLHGTTISVVDPCTGTNHAVPGTNVGIVNAFSQMCAHSNGSLYYVNAQTQIVRVDRVTGVRTVLMRLLDVYTTVGPVGIAEGNDHQLYVSMDGGAVFGHPWVVRVDPNTGATALVAVGGSQKRRGIAIDHRDSIYVAATNELRIHRTDVAAGLMGPLATVPTSSVFGWMTGHTDGNVYLCANDPSGGYVYQVNTTSGAVSAFKTFATSVFSPSRPDIVRGFQGCATPANRSTWGEVKTRYR